MSEALGVIDAPSGIETSTPSPAPKLGGKPSPSQKSSLGGGAQILKGFQELTGKFAEKTQEKSAIPAEKPLPSKVEKTDKVEKTEAEKVAEAQKVQSTEPVKGTDGMTTEERAKFVADKKAHEGWQTEKETVTKELSTLKQQLDTLKAEKEAHEKRVKELEPVALLQDIRLHPKYKDSIEKPMEKINTFLEKVCTKYSLKKGDLQSAIWNEDSFAGNEALAEMQAGMDNVTAHDFAASIKSLRDIAAYEDKLRADPAAAMTALNADKKKADEESKAKAEKTYQLAREKVWEVLPESFPFLKDVFKDEKLASEIKSDADAVQWDEMSPDAKAFYAYAGSVFLRQGGLTKADKDEIAQLKLALANASKQVSPANGTPHSEAEKPASSMKPSDFLRSKGLMFM